MIFCANPLAQNLPYRDEISAAIHRVLDGGQYILGKEVAAFEREFAAYLGADFAVGCANGTDALVLALKSLDIGSGDEVIVPSHTAVPTLAAVVMAGATPVYVDIEDDFYTLDPQKVEATCSDRTRAIIAVHLYGQSAALDPLLEIARARGLRLIEDCAQATGAEWQGKKLGTIGDIGCFSFFPTKNLGAIGDGGAVVCNDEAIANRLRRFRQYGWDERRISLEAGINSRLDELQAAILRIKLRHLDADNEARRLQASYYSDAFYSAPVVLPRERKYAKHVYHLYVLQVGARKALIDHLSDAGIHAGIHYPVPVHRMPAYRCEGAELPVSEQVADRVVSLPLYPGMEQSAQSKVVAAVLASFN